MDKKHVLLTHNLANIRDHYPLKLPTFHCLPPVECSLITDLCAPCMIELEPPAWPVLAISFANSRTFGLTFVGLNNALEYQN